MSPPPTPTMSEKVAAAAIAFFFFIAVYTLYGFAVGFKNLVEMPHKVRDMLSAKK